MHKICLKNMYACFNSKKKKYLYFVSIFGYVWIFFFFSKFFYFLVLCCLWWCGFNILCVKLCWLYVLTHQWVRKKFDCDLCGLMFVQFCFVCLGFFVAKMDYWSAKIIILFLLIVLCCKKFFWYFVFACHSSNLIKIVTEKKITKSTNYNSNNEF